MLNLAGVNRAPRSTEWMVEIKRKHSLNEYQNSRKRRVYVMANDEQTAKKEAMRQYPEFWIVSARRA